MSTAVHALECRSISKVFGGLRAIDNVSLAVPSGSVCALIGPNGAGKTTFFNVATNLFPPSSGEVTFFGADMSRRSPHDVARFGIIRTFQTARVFLGMTTIENVMAGAHLHIRSSALSQMLWSRKSRSEECRLSAAASGLLQMFDLDRYKDSATSDLPIGVQKLVEVVRALMAKPRLLLLDEPAAGLNDRETTDLATLLRAIRDSGTTILVVEHNMSLVMGVADCIFVLDAGRLIASGPPEMIQKDQNVIDAYLGRAEEQVR